MKKEITITPSLTREWMSGGNTSSSSGLITTLKKIVSVIVSISYNVLGFVALLVAMVFHKFNYKRRASRTSCHLQ